MEVVTLGAFAPVEGDGLRGLDRVEEAAERLDERTLGVRQRRRAVLQLEGRRLGAAAGWSSGVPTPGFCEFATSRPPSLY
jgi:hypothetical protein